MGQRKGDLDWVWDMDSDLDADLDLGWDLGWDDLDLDPAAALEAPAADGGSLRPRLRPRLRLLPPLLLAAHAASSAEGAAAAAAAADALRLPRGIGGSAAQRSAAQAGRQAAAPIYICVGFEADLSVQQ